MAQVITVRRLVTEVVLKSAPAVKALAAYDKLWKSVAKGAQDAAKQVNAAAASMASTVDRMATAAQAASAAVRTRSGGGSSGGVGSGGGSRRGADPLDAIVRDARRKEREAQRQAAQEQRTANRRAQSGAAQAGMEAGAKRINEATAALGTFAKASDRARAKVDDLSKQVERNRREMADLKAQALKTGDADGTLAARVKGLSVATALASRDLAAARKELRGFEGGLISAIKKVTTAKITVEALGTALGNALTGAVKGVAGGVAGVLGESAKSAMDFEKALVDVAKVAKDTDLTKDGLLSPKVKQGIKDVAKDLGVMPTEVAELTAQITAAFSGKTDIVALASDVTKIGVAWDITGKQAGEYFKQTSAGLQLNADETKALFGSINQLGNELGIKSSEIAEAMTRSAGVLKGANISGETGAALNATLIKAGASAEVAATGVRTFIARLGAGEAATDKQIKAFGALGLSAKEVAKNLSSGDAAKAEAQIKEVVAALVKMGKEAPDKRMATLIELFGSESIGSIGAAASAVDTLAGAFDIAGDKAAALTSVQSEYDRVSNTTAARVEKLKANIGVLAIELGEALLPYIDKVVNFLTSPEGQEWGAKAVETAKDAVVGLAGAVQSLAGFFAFLIENIGGVGTAVGVLGVAVAALAGPWGLAGAAATAALGAMVIGLGKVLDKIPAVRNAVNSLFDTTDALIAQENAKAMREATDAADDAGMRGPAPGGGVSYGYQPTAAVPTAPSGGGATRDPAADLARFNELVAARNSRTLKPSEAKELKGLSKSLDIGIPKKPGKGHKATKMDKQLAALDPALAGLLRQGGDEDAGGDLKVHDDPLSKAAFKAASAHGGMGGVGGVGSTGPGPSITNVDNRVMVTIQQAIDARGNGPAADNLRSAGQEVATRSGESVIRFVGANRVKALGNSGGRLTGA